MIHQEKAVTRLGSYLRRKVDTNTQRYVEHNRAVWGDQSYKNKVGTLLVEKSLAAPSVIALSYFISSMNSIKPADPIIYNFDVYRDGLKYRRKLLPKRTEILFNSIGGRLLECLPSKRQLEEGTRLFDKYYPSLKSNQNLYDLTIEGLWVGDILTDSYLKEMSAITVRVDSTKFQQFLKMALCQYAYWKEYFDTNTVTAIAVSHCVYLYALPLRVAIDREIPGYQVNEHTIYRITKARKWASTEFWDFRKLFRSHDDEKKIELLTSAKEMIEQRLNNTNNSNLPLAPWNDNVRSGSVVSHDRIINDDNNIYKVLVAANCFYDSPSGRGPNLFTDFYDWLVYLGNLSSRTNYEWFLKPHPDATDMDLEILTELANSYDRFQLVDKDVTVFQLCNEGIDCVLTMYGTVGFEAAVHGHLVVNASTSNQHVAYNFNLHPSTVEEYEKLLLDLPNIVWNIDRNEIYEFFAMCTLCPPRSSWTHNDIHGFIESLGGWGHPTNKNSGFVKHLGPISYKKFLDEFCLEKHHKRLNLVANYLCTGDYVMRWDKDFNLLRDGSQLSENSN